MEINGRDQDCWLHEIDHYTADCYDYGSYIQCGEWTIEYTESYIFCTPISGGGGGGTVPPPLCLPGSNDGNGGNNGGGNGGQPVTTMSTSGRLRVSQAQQPDPGDGGYGGDNSDPYAPTSDCTPVVDSSVVDYTIKNQVKDTCLHKMVDEAIHRNIEYELGASMNGIFNSNTNFNLTFTDGPMNSIDDGFTDSKIKTVPQNGRDVIVSINASIELNSNTLPGSTQEYITVAILHEALHAYFNATGQIFDHEVMVNKYIPWFKAAMHNIYPSLDDGDLTGLAYGGLLGTEAFRLSADSAFVNTYKMTNTWYANGTKGQKCH